MIIDLNAPLIGVKQQPIQVADLDAPVFIDEQGEDTREQTEKRRMILVEGRPQQAYFKRDLTAKEVLYEALHKAPNSGEDGKRRIERAELQDAIISSPEGKLTVDATQLKRLNDACEEFITDSLTYRAIHKMLNGLGEEKA